MKSAVKIKKCLNDDMVQPNELVTGEIGLKIGAHNEFKKYSELARLFGEGIYKAKTPGYDRGAIIPFDASWLPAGNYNGYNQRPISKSCAHGLLMPAFCIVRGFVANRIYQPYQLALYPPIGETHQTLSFTQVKIGGYWVDLSGMTVEFWGVA